jgi:glycerol-3-phosphate acyltransferase PlsY
MSIYFYFPFAYLIGSIPFGLILTKIAGHGDIRNIGSGNIGATNVLRTGNKRLALATLILDGIKGAAVIALIFYFWGDRPYPVYIQHDWGNGLQNTMALALGFFAILGHMFPVWLKFKGGKGVATALGVFLIAVPYAGLAACAAWLAAAFAFKYSSLAAIVAMAMVPIVTFFVYGYASALIAAVIAALVMTRHHTNIRRLLKGEEPKIGKK